MKNCKEQKFNEWMISQIMKNHQASTKTITKIHQTSSTGWWFGTWIFFLPYIGNNNPNWLCHIFQRGRSTIKHHQTSSNIIKHDRPVRYAEVNATIFRDTEEGMLLQMLFAAWPKTADFEPTFHRRWGKARCYNSPWGYNCSNKLGKIPSICGDGAKSLICMSWMVECHGMVICMACFGCGTEENDWDGMATRFVSSSAPTSTDSFRRSEWSDGEQQNQCSQKVYVVLSGNIWDNPSHWLINIFQDG